MARDVLIRLKKLSTTGKVPANAAVRFEPTVLRSDADGYILDDYFDAVMVDGEATVTDLPETDLNWAYKVQVRGHGRGAGLKQVYATWYVHLPADPDPENPTAALFEKLPRIDPTTLTPVNDPDPAWVDAVAAVFNDSVSTAVEPAMVTAAEDETSQFRSALNAASAQSFVDLLRTSYGSVMAPQPLTFAGLQQAAEDARSQGKVLVATGTLSTDQTLLLRCSHDLSTLTITYTGTGTAVQIGDPSKDVRAMVGTAPRVKYGPKDASGTGWDATSCGIELVNLIGANITIPHVYGFFDGLRLTGNGTGTVYNSIYLGRLENNKRNIHNTIGPNGSWNGENTFYGGQLSHLNSEPGEGVVQLLFTGSAAGGDYGRPTGLRFIGCSIETTIAERVIDVQAGKSIMFLGLRYEDPRGATRAPVHWGPLAADNLIIGGYNAERIIQTREAGAAGNSILAPGYWQMRGSNHPLTGTGGGIVANNSNAGSAGVFTVMDPGWAGEDPATNYRIQMSANYTRWKQATDAQPRVLLDHTGSVMFGDGVNAPTVGVGRAGTTVRLYTAVSTTAPTAGAAGALPATPAGYASVYIDGAIRKIPYY